MTDMGVLKADLKTGEGTVDFYVEFDEQSALFQADVLKDWIEQLTEKYEAMVREAIPPS